jgi:deoxyadenosine/deoxycytidine kinase
VRRSPQNLLHNIHHRNRIFEQYITPDYLDLIEIGYHNFLQQPNGFPCAVIDATDADLLHNPDDFNIILEALEGVL